MPTGTAILFFSTDDFTDITFQNALDVALAPYDGKMTIFIAPTLTLEAEKANLITLAAAGHELAIHSWSHSQLDKTTAFAITTTNANPTCDVDVATTTITLATSTAGNTVAFDYSSGPKTITDLRTALAGKGWTLTNTTNINNLLQLTSLADTAGAQAVPYSPLLDIVTPNYAFWRDEISDAKDWIVAQLGVTPTTMSTPWGKTTAGLQAYQQAVLGLIGVRGTGKTDRLSSVNIFNIGSLSATETFFQGAGTEALIRQAARHCYAYGMYVGGITVLYTHTSAQFSAQKVGWFADEIHKFGQHFVTFATAIAAIKADHATADNLTYTKSYSNVADFRLLSTSPCINAGVDVGLTTDYAGAKVPRGRAPDIGAYEYPLRTKFIMWE
jgi:peptidoglycan/xylan/chitin deacetylase (PgdA/CDA1 family)